MFAEFVRRPPERVAANDRLRSHINRLKFRNKTEKHVKENLFVANKLNKQT